MIPWHVTSQSSLSMEFSRQKFWSGLLFPTLGDLPDPGLETGSSALQAYSLPTEVPGVFEKMNSFGKSGGRY